MDSTLTRPLQMFVRGGILTTPDGRVVELGPEPVTVGRDPACDVQLEDREVSAFHVELCAVSRGVRVRDLGSTNGTYIGSIRVQEVILHAPAVLRVGGTKLSFEPKAKQRVDVGFRYEFGEMVGGSPRMRRVFQLLERVAPTELSVLVTGETGTGKELVARALHDNSPRRDGPFVVVDCGAIPASLAEGILFGHEKGVFTGATSRRRGALLEANGGTLFLDELGELPIELQPKLLRAIAERQVKRLGASKFEPLDVRVVAATRRNLTQEMNSGGFRSDLFFRIAQVRVELPPLRERLEDIPMLVETMCKRMGRGEAAPVVIEWIQRRKAHYDWPGNVRELANVVSVAAALAEDPQSIDEVLSAERVTGEFQGQANSKAITAYGKAKQQAIRRFEMEYFTNLMESCGGNISEMARRSGMERHHVRAFLRKLGLRK